MVRPTVGELGLLSAINLFVWLIALTPYRFQKIILSGLIANHDREDHGGKRYDYTWLEEFLPRGIRPSITLVLLLIAITFQNNRGFPTQLLAVIAGIVLVYFLFLGLSISLSAFSYSKSGQTFSSLLLWTTFLLYCLWKVKSLF